MLRTYSELMSIPNYRDRFTYLKLDGKVADQTFYGYRYLNQDFYQSKQWRDFRDKIIIRDQACDMAHPDYPIYGMVIVHHMNPLTIDDVRYQTDNLLNPEFVVCVSDKTHRAISYGSESLLPEEWKPRRPFDTCPWRK